MVEKIITPPNEIAHTIDYRQEIKNIIFDQNPLQKLHQTTEGIKRSHSDTLIKLKDQLDNPEKSAAATYQLIYECLPTFDISIQKFTNLGIPDEDLLQYGLTQLNSLIKSWQPNQETYFKLFIINNLKQKFKEYIASSYSIPTPRFSIIPIYFAAKKEFELSYDHPPNLNDWPVLNEIINEKVSQLPPDKKTEIETNRYLDQKQSEDLIYLVHQIVYSSPDGHPDIENIPIDEVVEKRLLREKLLEALSTLPPKQEKVLRLRYGIDDGQPKTQKETAGIIRSHKKYIGQIEAKALRSMKHPARSKFIRSFLKEEN